MNFRVIKVSLASFVAASIALQAKADLATSETSAPSQTHDERKVIPDVSASSTPSIQYFTNLLCIF